MSGSCLRGFGNKGIYINGHDVCGLTLWLSQFNPFGIIFLYAVSQFETIFRNPGYFNPVIFFNNSKRSNLQQNIIFLI